MNGMKSSFSSKTYGWQVYKPFDSVSVASINALTDEGVMMTTLREGTNTWMEMTQFMLDVEQYLWTKLGHKFAEFRQSVIIVMDNASIHKEQSMRDFMNKRGFTCVTLPQYTPEWNPLETAYSMAKWQLTHLNLNNRDFTFMVTETMKNIEDVKLKSMVWGQLRSNFGVTIDSNRGVDYFTWPDIE